MSIEDNKLIKFVWIKKYKKLKIKKKTKRFQLFRSSFIRNKKVFDQYFWKLGYYIYVYKSQWNYNKDTNKFKKAQHKNEQKQEV